jgi:hypothetical protein
MNIKAEINIPDEYKELARDLVKFTTILLVLNLLMFLANPNENSFLGDAFIRFSIFILLGIVTYWLVISKLIQFD